MRTVFENEGDIRSVDLLAGLVSFWREGASGSLQFSRSGATAGFEIVRGELVASSSSDTRFETAAILVRAGKLDARTLERLAASEGADRALLALQAGVLTRREYRWGEKIRAVEILSDLLTWLEGEYFYVTSGGGDSDSAEPRLPIPRLILELFLRSRDRSLVLKYLGGADVPLARAANFDAEFATFGLTADAESVVRLIDGTASAEDIAGEAPAEAFAVEKLLAALVTLGLVQPAFAGAGAALAAGSAPASVRAGGTQEEESEDDPTREDPDDLLAQPAHDGETPGEGEQPAASEFELEPEPGVEDQPVAAAAEMELASVSDPARRETEPDDREDRFRSLDEGERHDTGAERVDASFSGSAMAPDLEFAPLGAETTPVERARIDLEAEGGPGEFDRPLDTTTGGGEPERPSPRPISPLIWLLGILVAAVAGILLWRNRGSASASAPAAGPAPTATEAPSPALTPPAESIASAGIPTSAPAAAPPLAVATSAPAPARAATAVPVHGRPTPRPMRGQTKSAPATEPAPAAETSRQAWTDRAARDARHLAADHKTHYAIQLELACEVGSLTDAFQHDRPAGSMWLLSTPYEGRTCFRILWGRYPTIDAAKRGLTGAPKFFFTSRNHPAVTGVR
jgi:hypothetical protein